MKTKLLRIVFPLAFLIFVIGCQKNAVDDEGQGDQENLVADFNHSTVWEWNELFLRIDKDAIGYRPNPTPRALAYMGLSTYETAVAGMPSFKSLKNQFGPELKIPELPEGQKSIGPRR